MIPKHTAIKLFFFNIILGLILFLMIELLLGQTVIYWVSGNTDNSFMLALITIIGFLLSMVVAIISVHLTNDVVRNDYAMVIALLTFILNFILWIIIAYIFTWNYLGMLSFLQKFIKMGIVLTIFSSMLYSTTLLWFVAQITYSFIYVFLLVVVKAKLERKVYNSNKRHKGKWI